MDIIWHSKREKCFGECFANYCDVEANGNENEHISCLNRETHVTAFFYVTISDNRGRTVRYALYKALP